MPVPAFKFHVKIVQSNKWRQSLTLAPHSENTLVANKVVHLQNVTIFWKIKVPRGSMIVHNMESIMVS